MPSCARESPYRYCKGSRGDAERGGRPIVPYSTRGESSHEKRLQVSPSVSNEMDHDFVLCNLVDNTIGFEEDLPVFGCYACRQFGGTGTALRKVAGSLGCFK